MEDERADPDTSEHGDTPGTDSDTNERAQVTGEVAESAPEAEAGTVADSVSDEVADSAHELAVDPATVVEQPAEEIAEVWPGQVSEELKAVIEALVYASPDPPVSYTHLTLPTNREV